MKIQEMIKKCDECKLPECIQCEYSWSDVQEIKEEVKKILPQDKKPEGINNTFDGTEAMA